MRQFDILGTPVFVTVNRRRDQCQDNQGKYGRRRRDGNTLVIVFGQLDRYPNTEGKPW